jgi:hypothetical protein
VISYNEWSARGRRPDVAGICSALGLHDSARTHRAAAAMQDGRSWATRPVRRRPRTGRTWREQNRDGDTGQWIEGWA